MELGLDLVTDERLATPERVVESTEANCAGAANSARARNLAGGKKSSGWAGELTLTRKKMIGHC